MIRSIWTVGWGALVTGWYCTRVVIMALLSRNEVLSRTCDESARQWASAILWAAGVKVRLHGVENFRQSGAQLIVSNHESWFDLFALISALPVKARFVAKKELLRVPLFGAAWQACGHIPIDRSDRPAAIESLNEAGRRIKEDGLTIVMFPEGTRSVDGTLQPFKKGAFVLGLQAQVPIVPVAVIGARAIMRKGSFRIRKGEIHIRVGVPIEVEGLRHEDRDSLVLASRRAVAKLRGGEGPTEVAAEKPIA